MGDDWRRDGVEQLRARIVPQQQSCELVLLDERHGVAVLAILHRDADPVGEELPNVDRVRRHLHRCHQTFRCQQSASRFQLPRGEPVAHYRVGCDFERLNTVEETFFSWFEQRQVRFVIDHTNVRCRFLAGLRAFELDVILVCNQVRSDKDAPLGQNRAERAL